LLETNCGHREEINRDVSSDSDRLGRCKNAFTKAEALFKKIVHTLGVHLRYLCPGWDQVNYENGNGLDNRRENLRGVKRAD
jgi:hypothetical protein